jgi:hypothetical protein
MKKNILQITNYIGVILLAGSIFWWLQTYGFNFDYTQCIAYSNEICRSSSVETVIAESGYNPIVFWIGVICLVAGFGLKKFKPL